MQWSTTSVSTPKEIRKDKVITLGEGASSHNIVKKWAAEVRCGRES